MPWNHAPTLSPITSAVAPWGMSRRRRVSGSCFPVAVMTIAGFLGLLLAVPTAAVLKILVGHLWHTYVLGQPWEEVAAAEDRADARPGVGFVEDVLEAADEDEPAQPALRR